MFVNFNILNQLGSPAINSNTFANRPAAGQTGRLFVSTDTFEIYRDNGTTWDLIGGPGTSTITGTGTATQVAYFTSSQAIGSSANLFWDNTNGYLGINTATPGVELDVHGTGIIQQINSTGATANSLLAFQRSGSGLWRIGDNYNSGTNFFELYNTALSTNAIAVLAATNKTEFTAVQTYSSGLARGNYFDYNLSVPAGISFSSPNAITALGASLDLSLAGSATIPSGARTGLDVYNSVAFTGAGTLTMTQGSNTRAYSNLTTGWAFNGSAIGTITHLAGLRVLFPDNSGSTLNVTNNYGLLINNQDAGSGTITYTNRWGIYQEGASDLNYFAANLLLGSTTNSGEKLQVTGTAKISGNLGINGVSPTFPLYVRTGTNQRARFVDNGGLFQFAVLNDAEGAYSDMSIGNSAIFVQSTGNVGIGTTSPASTLSVYSTAATNVLQLVEQGTSGRGSQIQIKNAHNTGYYLGLSGDTNGDVIQYNGGNTNMIFYTNALERMRITSGGAVYIGTTSDATSAGFVANTGRVKLGDGGGFELNFNTSTYAAFQLASSEKMRITSGGNVLVNKTNNGTGAVQVKHTDTNFYTGLSVYGTTADNFTSVGHTGSLGVISSTYNSTGSYTPLAFYTSDLERMRITSGGNVLIGTTTEIAGYKLQVNGKQILYDDLDLKQTAPAITFDNGNSAGTLRFISINRSASVLTLKTAGQTRFVPLAADPAGAEAGDVYYNSGTNKLRLYDGTNWVDLN